MFEKRFWSKPKEKIEEKKNEILQKKMTRREFIKNLGKAGILAAGISLGGKVVYDVARMFDETDEENSSTKRDEESRETDEKRLDARELGSFYFRKKPHIPRPEEIGKINIENLSLHGKIDSLGVIGNSAFYGKIERALRYKILTDSIEDRYGLPRHTLTSIMIAESSGRDVLPNALEDGGIGLCHMQPAVAKEYNLKPVIGSKIRDREAGQKLKKLIAKYHENPIALSRIDQRFNPLANLDAAARFLMYYIHDKTYQSESGRFRRAFQKYSGRSNYWKKIQTIYSILNNDSIMKDIEESFNERNKNLTINGKYTKNPLREYWKAFWEVNRENYKLDEYLEKNPEKFDSRYLKDIRKTLDNFLIKGEEKIIQTIHDIKL